MTRRWLLLTVDMLAVLMGLYGIPLILFYGLSVRQLVAFRATLPKWVHWTLWGICFALIGLFYVLNDVDQRLRKQARKVEPACGPCLEERS